MSDRIFVETNVLIYARDPGRRRQAASWLLALGSAERACTNLQVLNELTNWVLRNERGRSVDDIREELVALRVWGDKPVTDDEVEVAWVVRDSLGYRWFDCLLLASAHNARCCVFLTEDMTHGATFGGLTLINPFRVCPGDVLQRN